MRRRRSPARNVHYHRRNRRHGRCQRPVGLDELSRSGLRGHARLPHRETDSVGSSQRNHPVATVDASSSSCSRAAPSRVLRLERSEARYGLGPSDLLEGFYAPSAASIESISSSELIPTPNAGLAGIRPKVAVDSLTRFEGLLTTVVGKPCSRAKHRVACQVRYAKALANPQAYGRANCGRCPVSPPALALLFTRGDNVRFVSDLRAFLGPIDTAADAVLLAAASDAVARLDGGAWLVKRSEIDGTCDPFERADVFEKISRDGRVTQVARVLASRQFGVCA